MKKTKLLFLLLPLIITSCGGGQNKSNQSGEPGASSPQSDGSVIDIEDNDEYDAWLNTWSQPDHLYFHYNRGTKGGYDNYCLWIWQHSPQDLEGALYGFSANPKVSDKLTLQPMTNHWMTGAEVGKTGDDMYVDTYGVIADVDLKATNLVGGKTGKFTTFQDYYVSATVSLKAGENTIETVVNNDINLFSTIAAAAPCVDSIRVLSTSTLTWADAKISQLER